MIDHYDNHMDATQIQSLNNGLASFIDLTSDDENDSNNKTCSKTNSHTHPHTVLNGDNILNKHQNGIIVRSNSLSPSNATILLSPKRSLNHSLIKGLSLDVKPPLAVLTKATLATALASAHNNNGHQISAKTQLQSLNFAAKKPISANNHLNNHLLSRSSGSKRSQIHGRLTPLTLDNSSTSNRIPFYEYFYSEEVDNFHDLFIKEVNSHPDEQHYLIKCHICKCLFSNIQIGSHVIRHFYSELYQDGDFSGITQCLQCMKVFKTPYAFQVHYQRCSVDSEPSDHRECLICEKDFLHDREMAVHFQNSHKVRDMPYMCPICYCFRASIYHKLLEHISAEHSGTLHLYCPYCLKYFSAVVDGDQMIGSTTVPVSDNYIAHLRRHINGPNIGCFSCRLVFFKSRDMKLHHATMHVGKSFKITDSSPKQSLNVSRLLDLKHITMMNDLPNTGRVCIECGEKCMNLSRHFLAYRRCRQCCYATCCRFNYAEHERSFHQPQEPSIELINKKIPIEGLMTCLKCGFQSDRGNTMALHLVVCQSFTVHYKYPIRVIRTRKRSFDYVNSHNGDHEDSADKDYNCESKRQYLKNVGLFASSQKIRKLS